MHFTRVGMLFGSLVLVAVVLWPVSLFAQGGSISGVVSDESGGVLPGATMTAVTESNGRYLFPNLLPGEYEIKAELEGFQTVEIKGDLIMRIGFEMTRDIVMPIGSVSETV